MSLFHVFEVFVILAGSAIAFWIGRWLYPPELFRVPLRWRWMTWGESAPDAELPMLRALKQRRVLSCLLGEGHAAQARGALREVDAILATIASLHQAMAQLRFGENQPGRYAGSPHIWVPNSSPRFLALRGDVGKALDRLQGIEDNLRQVALVGVQAASEKLLLELLVFRQDAEETRDSMLAAAVEICPPKAASSGKPRRKTT